MARFLHHAAQLFYFVACADCRRANQKANGALRKITDQFLDDGNCRIVFVRHAKKSFEFRIMLPAKTRVMFVRLAVEQANRLQDADGRSEIRGSGGAARAKKAPTVDDGGEVVGKRR